MKTPGLFLVNFLVLLVGTLLLSVLQAGIAKEEQFSLPLLSMLLAIVVGCVSWSLFGWMGTGCVLVLYAIYAILSGLQMRK